MSLSNMTSFVIGLASNTDDAEFQMEQAVQTLQTIFRKSSVSNFYQSASISGDGSTYTNAVMAGLTEMSHNELSEKLKNLNLNTGATNRLDEKRESLLISILSFGTAALNVRTISNSRISTAAIVSCSPTVLSSISCNQNSAQPS